MRIFLVAFIGALFPGGMFAQTLEPVLRGRVIEAETGAGLAGVTLNWEGTSTGTLSNEDGEFRLSRVADSTVLLVKFVRVKERRMLVPPAQAWLDIALSTDGESDGVVLEEVQIDARLKTTEISTLDPIKTEQISDRELLKAACCSLAESFETTPTVDVSFSDAVTGTHQIQMLGLAGPYTQIMREAMPDVRGFSAVQGLAFVPGTWIESIQLNKGTGSVVNGFESIAGQINVNLRRPEDMDRFYLNVYGNAMGRTEVNAHLRKQFNGNLSTAFLAHGRLNTLRNDRNADGFLDNPLEQHLIGLNRWKYAADNGVRFQAGVKATITDLVGGERDFTPQENAGGTLWGVDLGIRRLEGWAKLGKVYPERPWRSMGLQVSGLYHDQRANYAMRNYDANQKSLYLNYLYQSLIGTSRHNFITGVSLMYDDYAEVLLVDTFARQEIVPGGYFEYTYTIPDKLDLVAGLRVDYHNLFGAFLTPRLHLRYQLTPRTIFRISGGRGQRTANLISENQGLLASARTMVIQGSDQNLPYGLRPEIAWNYGVNFTQKFVLDYREGSFSLDLYRTDFQNQIVVDLDQSPQQAVFYNLDGSSFSNSFQAQVDYELLKRLDVRIAYRWLDVRTTYGGVLREKPLIAAHRAFLNLGYGTRNHWKFDATLNWQGSKRLPITTSNPPKYQLPAESDPFLLLHFQVSKTWKERWNVYLGGENLLNFQQPTPILASDQPFSSFFDGSMVWGPIFGRNIYAGMRLILH
ncbi:MAG: TonB-dependent receptor [Bacteroidota bacterium]